MVLDKICNIFLILKFFIMNRIFLVIIIFSQFSILLCGQKMENIKSIEELLISNERCYDLITDYGDEIRIKVLEPLNQDAILFADETYCIVVVKAEGIYHISACYKVNDNWIQDYTNRTIAYPSNNLSMTVLENIEVIGGSTLSVEYNIISEVLGSKFVKTDVVLGLYGFYDKYLNANSNLIFLNNVEKFEVDKSPRISNFELTKH